MLGLSIGNYKITAKIGEGGMGVVYRAIHDSLGRPAAVKVLLPEVSNSRDVVTRFFNEARSATSIRDPGIVDIYDFGFLPDQRAYIIMEMLEGETLAARLRRSGRMSHARALQVIRSVARALHAAHERSIVHRDMKPDNIFLVPDPEMPAGERVKLLDFGIAKLGGDREISMTQTGMVMGTPAYMAPEQCRGAGAVDRRADIYALGCILYELVCGRPPFIAEGAGDIMAHQLYFAPEPPRAHDPSLPEGFEALIMSLLAKDPAHRPQTAAQLVSGIDSLGILGGGTQPPQPAAATMRAPTGATPVTTISGAASMAASMAPARSSKRGWLAAAGALVVAGAAIAIVLASRGGDSTPTAGQPDPPPALAAAPVDPAAAAAPPPAATADPRAADPRAAAADPRAAAADLRAAAADPPAAAADPRAAAAAAAADPRAAAAEPRATAADPRAAAAEPRAAAAEPRAAAADPPAATPPAATATPPAATATRPAAADTGAPATGDEPKTRRTTTRPSSRKSSTRSKTEAAKAEAAKAEAAKAEAAKADAAKADAAKVPAKSETARPSSRCSAESFASVVRAEKPTEAAVQAALSRLRACEKDLPAHVFADLQQQLISKL